jgi:hypothetical protein
LYLLFDKFDFFKVLIAMERVVLEMRHFLSVIVGDFHNVAREILMEFMTVTQASFSTLVSILVNQVSLFF